MRPLRILSTKDLGEVNAFLGELKDGDLYKKRLKALEDQKAEINVLIEVYGKANDIDRIRSNALRDEDQAKKTLEEALADRAKAKQEAADMELAAKIRASGIASEANKRFTEREKALDEGERNLGEREKAHARSLDDLAEREKQVAAEMATAVAIRTMYTEAVANLKSAIENTAKAL